MEFTWQLCTPMYRPPSWSPDNLGLCNTNGCDARFPRPGLVLGPSRTTLDLGSVGGTAANLNAGAMMQRSSGGTEWFLYVLRGTRVTKIQVPSGNTALSLATTQPTNSATGDLADRGVSALVTKAPGGTPILSVGQEGANAYHNLTTVAAENAADTWSANNETELVRILGLGDRMFGFYQQTMKGNVLSATVDADDSAWHEIASFNDRSLKPTGFAMSENLALVGTNRGVLVLHAQYNEFFPSFMNLPASDDNCRAMRFVPFFGVVIPLVNQLRLQNGAYSQRIGPEVFSQPNDLQGTFTGLGFNADWAYGALRNPSLGKTYIMAFRPRQPGDWHGNAASFYCIDSFDTASEWVEVLEDPDGIRTNQVLAVGNADDLSYYRLGRTPNWTEDVSGTDNYLYQADTDQTACGNEMLFSNSPMRIERVIFEGSDLAAGRTLKVELVYRTATGKEVTMQVAKQSRDGVVNIDMSRNVDVAKVHMFKPHVTLRSNVTSASPCLKDGRITIIASPA